MKYIFESPKGERRRSGEIDASDERAISHLREMGWKVVQTIADPVEEDESGELAEVEVTESIVDVDLELAEGVWNALVAAGYNTAEALNAATDEQLREVPGVGPATLKHIRKALAPVAG